MIHLKIDNTEISVPEGTTVLDAAKSIGIEIPSMCYRKGFDNHPSCMVCLVKDKKTGNLVSSCALKVTDGMEIISADDEVKEARKEALELLMSDHVGDCEAPCSITCPAGMNIPQMNRLIASGKFEEALNAVKEEIALPYVLGYICPAPCEKACRRKQVDESVSICILKRFTAQHNHVPEPISQHPSSGKVAIIGAGPAGLAGAYYLQKMGYACVVFDKNENAGGNLRYAIPDKDLPKHSLDAEVEIIRQLGAEFRYNSMISADNFETEVRQKFDAVIVATGDIAISNQLTALFEGSKVGIAAEEGTFATSLTGVFACGSAIRSQKMAVRAVAQGKAAATSVDLYLKGKELQKPVKMFNSRFDKLTPAEYEEYLKESIPDNRVTPGKGMMEGFSAQEAMKEAARCLHCDCRKLDNCKLRTYAHAYTIDRKKYVLGERKTISKHFHHDTVVYEPEKCIKCGLCVDITLQNNELTGLSYVGRGFDVRIDVPFSQSLKEALVNTADKCVEACPTGALSSKKK